MYYVKGKSTAQYITLTDGSFVAKYQKLEFCDRPAGGPERERLGMTWTLFLFIGPGKGALTHHPPLAGGGMACGQRAPSGGRGWGGSAVSFPLRRYIQQTPTPTAAWASDAAASIYWGLGAVSHQQAAPGIYRGVACYYCQRPSKKVEHCSDWWYKLPYQFDKLEFTKQF